MTAQPQSPSEQEIHDILFDTLNCYEISAMEVQNGMTYVDSYEAEKIAKSLARRIRALVTQAADKREQETLELVSDRFVHLPDDADFGSWLDTRLAHLRQAAEGE